jgi:hypothetical protein
VWASVAMSMFPDLSAGYFTDALSTQSFIKDGNFSYELSAERAGVVCPGSAPAVDFRLDVGCSAAIAAPGACSFANWWTGRRGQAMCSFIGAVVAGVLCVLF